MRIVKALSPSPRNGAERRTCSARERAVSLQSHEDLRSLRECVVVHAGVCEPVSITKFPW